MTVNGTFNQDLCDEKHRNIDRRFKAVEEEQSELCKKVDKMKSILISLLVGVILNLIFVIANYVK